MSNKNGEFDKDKTPQIKTVKLVSAYNGGGVSVNNGIATNVGMPRVDIFYKDGKYYAVPIYIADFVKNKLPTLSKPHNVDFPIQLKENDKFYNEYYRFSLFKDEPILIEYNDKEKTKQFGYFCSYDVSDSRIRIESIDRSKIFKSGVNDCNNTRFSLNSTKRLIKFQVDPLGYITELKQEKRCGIIKDYKKQKNT